jgi:Sigma-70, region 4
MGDIEKKDRNQEIVELRTKHDMTHEEISKRYGITRQRVQQILKRSGVEGGVFFTNRKFHNVFNAIGVVARLTYREESELWHGTTNGYQNHNCRCRECKQAHSEWNREYRKRLSTREPLNHGYSGYTNYSCRCPICTAANTQKSRARRARRRGLTRRKLAATLCE